MKQGAFINPYETVPPWLFLIMEFMEKEGDKENFNGSFKALNYGIGWIIYDTSKEETCCKKETNICSICKK